MSTHARLIHLACPAGGPCKGHDLTPTDDRAPVKADSPAQQRRGRSRAYAAAAENLSERATAYDSGVARMLLAVGDFLDHPDERTKAVAALIKAADHVGIAVLAPDHPSLTPATTT